jgi:hypothetical protein
LKTSFLLGFALALLSCHENGEVQKDSFIAADRNGTVWEGTCEMQLDSSDTLRIWGLASEETLYMFVKFEGVGTYELLGHNAGFYQTLGGDVLISAYTLSTGTTGELTITEYDSTTRKLGASFSIDLEKVKANPENNVEYFRFTNGKLLGVVR